MASTPYYVWAPQPSASATAETDGIGFGSPPAEATALASQELAGAVARPRLRRQPTGQKHAAGPKKPPQRGLGVAELERLRCGGDPLRELSSAGDANASVGAHGHPFFHRHHLPAASIDAVTGARYYSSVLIQPSPAPPPPAAVCYVHSPAAGGHRAPLMAPEQQYFMDRWGRMGGFAPAGNAGSHQPQLPLMAPEHPSSQTTIWRQASSPSSCLHSEHNCNLCIMKTRTSAEIGVPTGTAAVTDYSIFDLAAAMANTYQERDGFLASEGKREVAVEQEKKVVREIEFFPTSTLHGSAAAAAESEFATAATPPFSTSGGGSVAPLDLSLRL